MYEALPPRFRSTKPNLCGVDLAKVHPAFERVFRRPLVALTVVLAALAVPTATSLPTAALVAGAGVLLRANRPVHGLKAQHGPVLLPPEVSPSSAG